MISKTTCSEILSQLSKNKHQPALTLDITFLISGHINFYKQYSSLILTSSDISIDFSLSHYGFLNLNVASKQYLIFTKEIVVKFFEMTPTLGAFVPCAWF